MITEIIKACSFIGCGVVLATLILLLLDIEVSFLGLVLSFTLHLFTCVYVIVIVPINKYGVK